MTRTTQFLRTASCLAALLFSAPLAASPTTASITQTEVFQSGTGGYAIYRIPAIIPTTSGTLLAFAEGRKNGAGDAGRIDLLLRRSSDGGNTWGPMQVVWSDGANTCGNPAPVVDASTGRVWLFSTWNLATDNEDAIHDAVSTDTRRVFNMHSDDDGLTWSTPDEITSSVKQPNWRWYATGPCHGIQLRDGRLVIPANHSSPNGRKALTSSHVIFSDDHGATWRTSKSVGGHTNESTVAEVDDGKLYLNMRSYRGLNRRTEAWSANRGNSWSAPLDNSELVEPVCQASVLRYPMGEGEPPLFFFSNPASVRRCMMTVRVSRDACRTWSSGVLVNEGRSAYSDLCPLPDKQVGLLYERESGNLASGRITFARIPVGLLLAETTPTERTDRMTSTIRAISLPNLPDPNGFAGMFAGKSGGALIAAGGANFPDKKPWEGGKKVWYDTVFLLKEKAANWTIAGQLPRPLGYGVSITIPEGVLCIGGEDAQQTYADVFLMKADGNKVTFTEYPKLPAPCANSSGALLGNQVYIMGGTSRPGATAAGTNVYSLDLQNVQSGWQELESWPGAPRMLATAAALDGSIYLCSGVDLKAGSDGKPARTYLTDAYQYTPVRGWKRIAELPRSAVAAPSPAPAIESSFFIIGGDDGKLAGRPPGDEHPGFTRTALRYDATTSAWTEQRYPAQPQVTLPAFPDGQYWVLPSGEVRPGVRTPKINMVQITKE